MSSSPQGRPGVNGYKGEKGEPGGGAGYGYPVSISIITNTIGRLTGQLQKKTNEAKHSTHVSSSALCLCFTVSSCEKE